jgi:SAM-dependent methyltransferase
VASTADTRSERERIAYEEDRVFEEHHRWHERVSHVLDGPNTQRGERRWEALLREAARGGRVLDIGCGRGASSRQALDYGAGYVLGVDVADSELDEARALEIPDRLEFRRHDLFQPLDGTFDLIFGRSILHHIDYRAVVRRLYDDNLAPGGTAVFMEPLGANLLTRAFHRFVHSAHTPDERPLMPDELAWFAAEFPGSELVPVNYLSYPAGIASSLVLRRPDNALMRLADRIDQRLERRPRMAQRFRQGIIVLRKPASTPAQSG